MLIRNPRWLLLQDIVLYNQNVTILWIVLYKVHFVGVYLKIRCLPGIYLKEKTWIMRMEIHIVL